METAPRTGNLRRHRLHQAVVVGLCVAWFAFVFVKVVLDRDEGGSSLSIVSETMRSISSWLRALK